MKEAPPGEIWRPTIRWILRYFPETDRRTVHNMLSRDGSIFGVPLPKGVIHGRELHHTEEQLETWRAEVNRRLLAQITDLGRTEPQAVK